MGPPGHSEADHYRNGKHELWPRGTSAGKTEAKMRKSQACEGMGSKFLNVTSKDFWNLQKILHSKKRSPGKTCKTNTEPNAKVFYLNQKTMKALETLAFLYSVFEQAGRSLGEVDQLFDKGFVVMQEAKMRAKEAQRLAEIVAEQVCDRRDEYHRLSEEYEAAEEYLNDGPVCIRELVPDTAAATHSLSCGTNDRDCNEVKYLQEALDLLESARTPITTSLSSSHQNVLFLHEARSVNAACVEVGSLKGQDEVNSGTKWQETKMEEV